MLDFLLNGIVAAMTLLALIPLFSVVLMLLWRGGRKLSLALFTQLPPAPLEQGGGFGNAIVGTLIIVALAVLVTRAHRAADRDLPRAVDTTAAWRPCVRFCAKVLTGFPSILAGVFAYGAVVLVDGRLLGAGRRRRAVDPDAADDHPDLRGRHPDGAAAHARRGHRHGRDAHAGRLDGAAADGVPGILTGVMLAVARAAGETAPLLFTALFSNYWLWSRGQTN